MGAEYSCHNFTTYTFHLFLQLLYTIIAFKHCIFTALYGDLFIYCF